MDGARRLERLTAGGSMPLPRGLRRGARAWLGGIEFGVAIPATLGGAVRMNAGAHGRSMDEVVDQWMCS